MPLQARITVAAVIEQDSRFLMVEERIDGSPTLNQPAGHLEDSETLLEAIVREVREETAWDFQPQGLIGIYRWRQQDSAKTFIRFCFTGQLLRHYPDEPLDPDINRTLWLSAEQITEDGKLHRSPLVGRCLGDYLKKTPYPIEILGDIQPISP